MEDVTETIQKDIDQIEKTGEFHSVAEYNVDMITQIGPGMNKIIGMILEEVISEEI